MLTLFALAHATTPEPAEAPAPEAPAAEASGATTYAVDPGSWLAVLVKYSRSALAGGHDHVVTPNRVEGSITWDANDPSACDVKLSFPVDALQVDPPGSRARFKLEGETADGDKEKIKKNLSGDDQLEKSKFPRISYQSTRCEGTGEKVKVTGGLTIHGVTKTVSSDLVVKADGSTFSAKGGFSATHADFGMEPFSALFGALKNDESLTFQLNVTGKAR